MPSNARFYVLIVVVVAFVAGFWFLTQNPDAAPQVPPVASRKTAQSETEAPAVAEAPAPERRRASREVAGRDASATSPKAAVTGAGSIKGVVKDKSGNPTAGATVRIMRIDWKFAEKRPDGLVQREASTDGSGSFSFGDLPVDVGYGVEVFKDDLFTVESAYLSKTRPSATMEITIDPAKPIGGIVVDGNGDPVKGALLWATRRFPDDQLPVNETEITRQETDADGAFRFPHVPDGKWKMLVKAEGFAPLMSDWLDWGKEDAELVLSTGGQIAGTVIDSKTREPKPQIKVQLTTSEYRELTSDMTDADGAFLLPNLRDTEYSIGIDSETLTLAKEVPKIALAAGQDRNDIVIEVARGGTVTGQVTDAATGKPVANVELSMYRESGATALDRNKEATTDEDGVYSISGVPAGRYNIMVQETKGYVQDWQRRQIVNVAAEQNLTDINFVLESGATLSGDVVDEKGKPIADARVIAVKARAGNRSYAQTDAGGHFEIAAVEVHPEIFIRAEKEGFANKPLGPMEITAEGKSDIQIVMTKEASISGVVVDKSGNPVPNAEVIAWPVEDMPFGLPTKKADAKGAFTVGGLIEGDYRLQAQRSSRGGFRTNPNAETTHVGPGEAKTGIKILVEGAEGKTIAGRIADEEGNPIRDCRIDASGQAGYGFAESGADGRYEIAGLSDGEYSMNVQSEAFTREHRGQVAAGSANVDFVLKGRGAIEGTVVDASTNSPVRNYEIFYSAGEARGPRQMQRGQPGVQVQSEDGAFKLDSIEAGTATLHVRGAGYAPATEVVTGIESKKTRSGIAIRMEAGASVAGRVVDSSGQPIAGAKIYEGPVPMQDYERESAVRTTSAADGSFTLDGLPVGTVTVSAYSTQYAGNNVQVATQAGKATPVEIVLGSGGTVFARVTVDGAPATSAYVGLHTMNGGSSIANNVGSDGTYEFKNVTPGEYNAYCGLQDPGGDNTRNRNQNKSVTVVEGETVEILFDFQAGNATLAGSVLSNGQTFQQMYVMVQAGMTGTENLGESRHIPVDASGEFRMENLPAGQARVTFMAVVGERQTMQRIASVELVANQTAEVKFDLAKGARISGTVTGARAGEQTSVAAIAGSVPVPAKPTREDFMALYADQSLVGVAMIDPESGTFTLEGLEPGPYTIIVVAVDSNTANQEAAFENIRVGSATVTVPEDAEPDTVSITLP